MTTTRARAGSSVIAGGLLEEPLEVRAVELRERPVVLLHPPGPEVEVQGADRILDRGPQRPAVLRHQPPEPSTSDAVPEQPAVVRPDQRLQVLERQGGLAPDVAELEVGVVVAAVLVADQPELLAVVEEGSREQVVVARNRRDPA